MFLSKEAFLFTLEHLKVRLVTTILVCILFVSRELWAAKLRHYSPTGYCVNLIFSLFSGHVYFIDEKGERHDCLQLETAIHQLLYYDQKDYLIVLTTDLQVSYFVCIKKGLIRTFDI